MKKTFRPWQVDQSLLLPPSVHEFVPADHPAHFVRDLVRDVDFAYVAEGNHLLFTEEQVPPSEHYVTVGYEVLPDGAQIDEDS